MALRNGIINLEDIDLSKFTQTIAKIKIMQLVEENYLIVLPSIILLGNGASALFFYVQSGKEKKVLEDLKTIPSPCSDTQNDIKEKEIFLNTIQDKLMLAFHGLMGISDFFSFVIGLEALNDGNVLEKAIQKYSDRSLSQLERIELFKQSIVCEKTYNDSRTLLLIPVGISVILDFLSLLRRCTWYRDSVCYIFY